MEKSSSDPADARLRRSRISGTVAGAIYGLIGAAFLAPVLVVGAWHFLTPAYAFRVTIVSTDLAPFDVERIDLGGWPLTPNLRTQGAIEYRVERERRATLELAIDIRRQSDGRRVQARLPVRAQETQLMRPSTHICDLVLFISMNAIHETPCLSGTDMF